MGSSTAAATGYRLSLRALRTLPGRLCSPPPAVGKARSCTLTPIFKVKLDDVLANKHLPPLTLHDFEQYMHFVAGQVELLYFALWLKEYTVQYDQWVLETNAKKAPPIAAPASRAYNHSLASFYARARQTFFVPGAEYELDVAADILAPFIGNFEDGTLTSAYGPHPDPAVDFSELAQLVNLRLSLMLKQCVIDSYTNVGYGRARCGIIAGNMILLAGTVAPLALNFTRHWWRWQRLAAFPGLMLGLTVLIASLHGVCLMIYVFGDLRQLRKYELKGFGRKSPLVPDTPPSAQPQAFRETSSPRFLASPSPFPHVSGIGLSEARGHKHLPAIDTSVALPELVYSTSTPSLLSPVPITPTRFPPSRKASIPSSDISFDGASTRKSSLGMPRDSHHSPRAAVKPKLVLSRSSSRSSLADAPTGDLGAGCGIEVSVAFYDEMPDGMFGGSADPVEPVAVPVTAISAGRMEEAPDTDAMFYPPSSPVCPCPTASFIPEYTPRDDDIECGAPPEPDTHISFTFDGLPLRAKEPAARRSVSGITRTFAPASIALPPPALSRASSVSRSVPLYSPAAPVGRFMVPDPHFSVILEEGGPDGLEDGGSLVVLPLATAPPGPMRGAIAELQARCAPAPTRVSDAPHAADCEARRHEMLAVPAFASPLTRILSPVVARAQWEIVVRSAAIAGLVSVVFSAIIVAVPVA